MPWGLTPSCVPAERLQEVARGERAWATATAPAVAGAPPRHTRRAGSRCGWDEEGGRASVEESGDEERERLHQDVFRCVYSRS